MLHRRGMTRYTHAHLFHASNAPRTRGLAPRCVTSAVSDRSFTAGSYGRAFPQHRGSPDRVVQSGKSWRKTRAGRNGTILTSEIDDGKKRKFPGERAVCVSRCVSRACVQVHTRRSRIGPEHAQLIARELEGHAVPSDVNR